MSPLWVLPLVVLAAGSVAVAVAARRLLDVVRTLRPGLDDLRTLAVEAAALRVDAESARDRGAALLEVAPRLRPIGLTAGDR